MLRLWKRGRYLSSLLAQELVGPERAPRANCKLEQDARAEPSPAGATRASCSPRHKDKIEISLSCLFFSLLPLRSPSDYLESGEKEKGRAKKERAGEGDVYQFIGQIVDQMMQRERACSWPNCSGPPVHLCSLQFFSFGCSCQV